MFDIVSQSCDHVFILQILDPSDLALDLKAVQQRASADVPQMNSTIVTAREDIGCHDLERRQLLVIIIERNDILDLAASPIALSKQMSFAEVLPVGDVGRQRLWDVKVELALNKIERNPFPYELVRGGPIEQLAGL